MDKDKKPQKPKPSAYEIAQALLAQAAAQGQPLPPGTLSNMEIRRRNGWVKHMFEDDIGGCSANYR